MSKPSITVKLKPEQLEELKKYGVMGDHWCDVVAKILVLAKQSTEQTTKTNATEFKMATVDKYGKAMISRTLSGQTIEYRVRKRD